MIGLLAWPPLGGKIETAGSGEGNGFPMTLPVAGAHTGYQPRLIPASPNYRPWPAPKEKAGIAGFW